MDESHDRCNDRWPATLETDDAQLVLGWRMRVRLLMYANEGKAFHGHVTITKVIRISASEPVEYRKSIEVMTAAVILKCSMPSCTAGQADARGRRSHRRTPGGNPHFACYFWGRIDHLLNMFMEKDEASIA